MSAITTICSDSDPLPPLDVAAVFSQIQDHHQKACDGILHMVKAGELLAMLKRKLPHGQFIKMATQGTGLSRSTVSRYMMIAANGARVGHLASGRDAVALIASLNAPEPPPPARQSTRPLVIEAEIVEPSPPPATITQEPQYEEPEPLVVDGMKTAPALKEEDEFISIRVSALKAIIADIDKGFSLIRGQETFIEDAIEAGKIKLTGNGDDIIESYMLAVGKAQSQIGSAIDRIEWNVPQKLRGPSTFNLENLNP